MRILASIADNLVLVLVVDITAKPLFELATSAATNWRQRNDYFKSATNNFVFLAFVGFVGSAIVRKTARNFVRNTTRWNYERRF